MIDRYSLPAMREIWTEKSKLDAFLEIEILSVEAWSELGVIPTEDARRIRQNASYDVERMHELELALRHDVVAFTRAVSESLGDEKKWVHYGLTSTDVVDTANGVLLKRADELILKDLEDMLAVLASRAREFERTPCIGRTHGIHADITSFGLKLALWYEEMKRNLERFKIAAAGVECGKISGAVGNFANIPPFVQDYVCSHLGIDSARISTQVLQRDRHAFYLSTLALIATTLEQIATEIRNSQRTEVGELEEPFGSSQKGSSAMPHKRNPIGCENICGCARLMRGYMSAAFEDVALWYERDISHSSVERVILPDATCLIDYMLQRLCRILQNMSVNTSRMIENINRTHGVIFSQRVMNALIDKGLSREKAYDLVQSLAMRAIQECLDFKSLIMADTRMLEYFSPAEVSACFSLEYYFKEVDTIFKRVGI